VEFLVWQGAKRLAFPDFSSPFNRPSQQKVTSIRGMYISLGEECKTAKPRQHKWGLSAPLIICMDLSSVFSVFRWYVIISSVKAKAVKTRQRNKCIYDTANNRFHPAKYDGDKVKPKQAD